jgi:hypothetical protein
MLRLPPHNAAVWIPCAGAAAMRKKYPAPPSDERSEKKAEGLAFHELSEIMLTCGTVDLPDMIDTMSSFGVIYDAEMYDAAVMYAGDIFETTAARGHAFATEFNVEHELDLSHVIDDQVVRVDCWAYIMALDEIVLWEAKFGHKVVDPFENWQCMLGVEAIAKSMHIDGERDQVVTVRIKIVQPRSFTDEGPIREWVFKLSELRGHMNIARAAALDARSESPRCTTGAHCASCDAAHACEALQASTYNAIDHVSDTSGLSLTGTDLSLEYSKLLKFQALLKSRLTGLEQQVLAEVKAGIQGHHFTGVMGYGNKNWTVGRDKIIALAEMYEVCATKETDSPLITPAQLIKLGVDESVISEYSARPPKGIKLVEQTANTMRRIFNRKG